MAVYPYNYDGPIPLGSTRAPAPLSVVQAQPTQTISGVVQAQPQQVITNVTQAQPQQTISGVQQAQPTQTVLPPTPPPQSTYASLPNLAPLTTYGNSGTTPVTSSQSVNPLNFVKSVAQGTARSGASVGATISEMLGGPNQLNPNQGGALGTVENALFGDQVVKSLTTRSIEAIPKVQDLASRLGINLNKGGAAALSTPLILGMTALDFSGWGGEENGAIKALSKANTEGDVLSILKKANVADDLAKIYAPKIAETTNPATIKNLLNNIAEVQKTTKAPAQVIGPTVSSTMREPGFLTSLKENPVTAPVFQNVQDLYPQLSNQTTIDQAKYLIASNPEAAKTLAFSGEKSAAAVATRIQLMSDSLQKGDIATANFIAGEAAKQGTEIGQAAQAHAILAKSVEDPASALLMAKKLKPDLTDAEAKAIVDKSTEISTLPDGIEKSYKANLLQQRLNSLEPASNLDKGIALWKAGLVSALPTKLVKAGSELTKLGSSNLDNVVATGVDKFLYLFSKTRTTSASLGGLAEQFKAIKPGASATVDYLKTGVGSGLYDHLKYVLKQSGIDTGLIGKEVRFDNPILDGYTLATFRGLSAETVAYKEMAVRASLYEDARVAALNEGLKGKAFTQRVQELYKTPTDEMAANAINLAEERTFQNKNGISKMISAGKKAIQSPVGKVAAEAVLPFSTIPTNIGIDIAQHTPLGFVTALVHQLQPATRGQKILAKDLSKAITGTGVIALGAWLGSKGLMTGNYPTNKQEADAWQAEGKQPNSILINGRWMQLGRMMGPTGELLGLGVDAQNAFHDNQGIAAAAQVGAAGLKKLVDQPFLLGLSGLFNAVQNPSQGGTFVNNTVGSLIPNFITKAAKSIDATQRNAKGFLPSLESRIPGLSQKLPAKVDLFGNPISTPGGHANFIDPTQSIKSNPSPILDEAQKVGATFIAPNQNIYGVNLTNSEYTKYLQVQGKIIQPVLDTMIKSDAYKALTVEDQKAAFEKVVNQVRPAVDKAIFPVFMRARYNIPDSIDNASIDELFQKLESNKTYKGLSSSKKDQLIQKVLANLIK